MIDRYVVSAIAIVVRVLSHLIEGIGLAFPQRKSLEAEVPCTIRRECLDWLIPLSEAHLRRILKLWIAHYNRGRPHMVPRPGVPDPPVSVPAHLPFSLK